MDDVKAIRKRIIQDALAHIAKSDPNLYYQSTSTIARLIHEHLKVTTNLSAEEAKVISELNHHDIEAILSFH